MSQASKLNELKGLGNGVSLVFRSFVDLKTNKVKRCLTDKNYQNDMEHFRHLFEDQLSRILSSSPEESLKTAYKKGETLFRQTNTLLKSDLVNKYMPNFFNQKRNIYILSSSYSNRQSIYSSLSFTQTRSISVSKMVLINDPKITSHTQKSKASESKYNQKVDFFLKFF